MTSRKPFSVRRRIESFRYAFAGFGHILRDQHNFWIHLAATVLVVIAGVILKVNHTEWCLLVIAIALVWITEFLNTALEMLADFVSPEKNETIRRVKDISAAAVLMASIGALIIGVIVFLPLILDWFRGR